MNLRKTALLIGLVATSAWVVAGQGQRGPTLQVNQEAPNFTLPDTNGKNHNLTDFRGKYVVLEWTNHLCPYVVKHYSQGDMQALQKWATEKGVVWLNVLSSAPGKQGYFTADEANAWRKEAKFNSTAYLLDAAGTVGRSYGARTTPHMYIIDPKGNLIYQGAIDDNRSANAADVKTARNHVKAALEESWAGKPVSVPVTQPYGCSVKYP